MNCSGLLEDIVGYLVLAYSLVVGVSRAGINIIVALLALCLIIRLLFIRPVDILIHRDLKVAFICFFSAIFLSVLSSHDVAASSKAFLLAAIKFSPFFAIVILMRDHKVLNKSIILLSISLLIASLVAIYQGTQGAIRATGLLGIMDFAGVLCLLIPFLTTQIFNNHLLEKKIKTLLMLAISLAIIALLFNGTRGVWVSTACALFLIGANEIIKDKKYIVYFLGSIIIIGLVIGNHSSFFSRLQSIANINTDIAILERFEMWQYAVGVITNHWLLGMGLGAVPGHVHNNILQILVESGTVGLVGVVFLFATFIRLSYGKMNKPVVGPWALSSLACTVALLTHGFFDYTFSFGIEFFTYCFLMGLCCVGMDNKQLQ